MARERTSRPKDDMRLEYLPLDELVRWPKNPKDHDTGAIKASLDRFGFTAPLLVDETTGRLVAGHGRIDTLEAMRKAKQKPPARIRIDENGRWLVPVIRGLAFQDEQAAAAYLLADNRLVELGGWRQEELAAVLRDLAASQNLEATGFDTDDLDALLRDLARGQGSLPGEGTESAEGASKRIAAAAAKWQVELGQVWTAESRSTASHGGQHRILCGDATSTAVVLRLCNETEPDIVLADPPYGMELDTDWSGAVGSLKAAAHGRPGNRHRPVRGDSGPFDPGPLFRAFGRSPEIFLFGADYYSDRIPDRESGSWLVWDKRKESQSEAIGSEFELIWSKARHKRRLLRHDWFGFLSSVAPDEARGRWHPTQKPTSLLEEILVQWSKAGALVIDPYLGSGSTVLAAEACGRVCYGVEIEPAYVAVTLERLATAGLQVAKESV